MNIDADALSRIPWEMNVCDTTPLDPILLKSMLLVKTQELKIPHLVNVVVPVCELIIRTELELSKSQWKREQRFDYSIKRFIELLQNDKLLEYKTTTIDNEDLKCMLRSRKEFFVDEEMLY